MENLQVVRQKPGIKDCQVACCATVMGVTYEEAVRVFKFPLDEDGKPVGLEHANSMALVLPLYDAGFYPTMIIGRAVLNDGVDGSRFPTSEDLKSILPSKLALIGYCDREDGQHMVIWNHSELVFCDYNQPDPPLTLEDITVAAIIVLEPRPSSSSGTV